MNVVFDFGNVLFHWQPPALLARLLPEQAHDAAAAAAWVDRFFEGFGGDWGEFDRGQLEAGVLAERIAARTGLAVAAARRVIDAVPHELRAEPAMVDLVQRLRVAGHRLYYLSNMPATYAAHLEAHHPFLDDFDGGVFSARVALIKPDPAIYALVADRYALDPPQTLFVDDVQHNVDAAVAAGWHGLRFVGSDACNAALGRLGLFERTTPSSARPTF